MLDRIISSHAMYLELKISTPPLYTDGLRSVTVVRLNLGQTPAFSPSLRYDSVTDAASYICGVIVGSSYLASDHDIISMNSLEVRIIIQCELIIILLICGYLSFMPLCILA